MSRAEIIRGEPIAAYHASGNVGHSALEVFRDRDRGPAKFHGTYITKTIPPKERTDAMDIGQAVDALVLERKTIFESLPLTYGPENKKFTMGANECKRIYAGIEARGLIPLHQDDAATVRAMYDAVMANPIASALLSKGEAQTSLRYNFGPFKVQIRPDWRNTEGVTLPDGTKLGHYMCDLKSADDEEQFQKNRRNFGYDRQNALYAEIDRMVLSELGGVQLDQVPEIPFFFIVVYKTAPVQCVVTVLEKQDLEDAKAQVVEDIRRLKECFTTGNWPGVPSGIVTMQSLDRDRAWKTNRGIYQPEPAIQTAA